MTFLRVELHSMTPTDSLIAFMICRNLCLHMVQIAWRDERKLGVPSLHSPYLVAQLKRFLSLFLLRSSGCPFWNVKRCFTTSNVLWIAEERWNSYHAFLWILFAPFSCLSAISTSFSQTSNIATFSITLLLISWYLSFYFKLILMFWDFDFPLPFRKLGLN